MKVIHNNLNKNIILLILVTQISCGIKNDNEREFYIKWNKSSYHTRDFPHFKFLIEYDNPTNEAFLLDMKSLYLVYEKDTLRFGDNYDNRFFQISRTTDKVQYVFYQTFYKENSGYIKDIIQKGQLFVDNKGFKLNTDSLRKHYFNSDSIEFSFLKSMEIPKSNDFKFLKKGEDIWDDSLFGENLKRMIDIYPYELKPKK